MINQAKRSITKCSQTVDLRDSKDWAIISFIFANKLKPDFSQKICHQNEVEALTNKQYIINKIEKGQVPIF